MNSVWNQGEWGRIVSWQHIYMHNNWFINPRISDFESDCKRKQEKKKPWSWQLRCRRLC